VCANESYAHAQEDLKLLLGMDAGHSSLYRCVGRQDLNLPESTKIITLGNRAYSFDGEKLAHQAHFIYFVLNEDSKAIKIGRARDLGKRVKVLQTSSPARLKLIHCIQVDTSKEAEVLEKSLHRQFSSIRLA
jgi:hypothetical protein